MAKTENIGLVGMLRAGKDAVAAYLCDKYGYKRFAFGDALKDAYHRAHPDVPRYPKPRSGYQGYGQQMRSLVGENVWLDACLLSIREYAKDRASGQAKVVVTDIRQWNEFSRCRSEGYVIIRVNAPVDVRLQRAIESGDVFSFADFRHETESHVDTFPVDYDVYNVGTLDELYAQIDAIINALRTEDDGEAR